MSFGGYASDRRRQPSLNIFGVLGKAEPYRETRRQSRKKRQRSFPDSKHVVSSDDAISGFRSNTCAHTWWMIFNHERCQCSSSLLTASGLVRVEPHNPFDGLADAEPLAVFQNEGLTTIHDGTVIPTDACLGVDGRPQSASGQTTILTGVNVPATLGYTTSRAFPMRRCWKSFATIQSSGNLTRAELRRSRSRTLTRRSF